MMLTIAGGWTPAADPTITDEVKALLDKGMEGLVGVNYTPVAYLGSQVVSGTNHAILCQATVVYPGATPYFVIVYLYEDLQGNVSLMSGCSAPTAWTEGPCTRFCERRRAECQNAVRSAICRMLKSQPVRAGFFCCLWLCP